MDFKIKSSLSQPHKNLHPMNMGGDFIAACKKSSADQNITTVGRPKARAKRVKTTQEKGCQGLDKVQTDIACTTAAEPNLGVCTFLHAALESSNGERLFHALLNL